MSSETPATTDYRNTLNLPETSFPMKANLPTREPEQIKVWLQNNIYEKIQEKNKSKKIFCLPDGPPYANGNIHVGHCLNKILKDFVIKYKSMSGHRSVFIPGWDCHGLPIEHAVSKELGPKRREKSDAEIRKLCRDYAQKYVNIQREQFKRLGILADWEHPYKTMDDSYEASMIRALGDILDGGYIYRGEKPVHWCWSDGTALAEAEVEYADRKDPSIYVKFEVIASPRQPEFLPALAKLGVKSAQVYFVIWTTTPWTLPANLAISLGPDYDYGLYEVGDEKWIVATALAENVSKVAKQQFKLLKTFKGADLGGTQTISSPAQNAGGANAGSSGGAATAGSAAKPAVATLATMDKTFDGVVTKHPFIDRPSYVILGDHVTLDSGTGAVHTAPGHGQEDYVIGQKYKLPVYNPVDDWGKYTDLVPEWKGVRVLDANPKVVEKLRELGALIHDEMLEHSFPHCWRCHNPVIFRATAQWFISMDQDGKRGRIRGKALEAIKSVKWYPSWGENRITAMVENRPDWCISRQRLWGVPIPVFYCESCGEAKQSPQMLKRVAERVEKQGLESYYTSTIEDYEPGAKCSCGHNQFRRGTDILDVWFDSGVCHIAVQEHRDGLTNPADMYLEGSDQHRGWFQSSLMTSVAIHGRAPFKAIITHGFVNDAQGRKMSKSLGNVVDPLKFMEKSGAEILRLWTAYEDYSNDLAAGQESFDRVSETYRRVRNTCRYILSNLSDFDPERDSVSYEQLLEIDKWALSKLADFMEDVTAGYEKYEFHKIYHALVNYCTVDLSAIYLDILKDRLYTWKKTGLPRRAAQTVIYTIARNMMGVMAPIISFLAEEVYQSLPGKKVESIFLTDYPAADKRWQHKDIEETWGQIFEVRSHVTKQLEEARQNKLIGSGLEAKIDLTVPKAVYDLLKPRAADLPGIFIVSQVDLHEGSGMKAEVKKAEGIKCERCWNYDVKTGANSKFPGVCPKCVGALS